MKKLFCMIIILQFSKLCAQDDYEKWLGKENQKFQTYVSENDKQFADFLKKNWKEFQLEKGIIEETVPKPKVVPIFKTEDNKSVVPKPKIEKPADPIKEVSKNELPPIPERAVKKPIPVEEKKESLEPAVETQLPTVPRESPVTTIPKAIKTPEPPAEMNLPAAGTNLISFDFYGVSEQAPLITKLNIDKQKKIDGDYISDFWLKVSATNFAEVLSRFQKEKNDRKLNDWGYFMMIKKYSEKIFPESSNLQNLLSWYFLIKSNYKMKVGLINNNVFLFTTCKQHLYFIPYFKSTQGQDKIYLMNLDNLHSSASGSLYTHEKDYPGADKVLDMNLYNNNPFVKSTITRHLKFEYDRKEYDVKVPLDTTLISFYKKYPNCQFDVYFNAQVQPSIINEVLPQLKEIVKGKNEYESVNMILRFCQTAFGYKMDDENFGTEKTLFVDETLYYPNSDCEDRSVIFSFLVRKLFGLDVVGIDYPGHVATAVKFKTDVKGFEVNYKNQKYILCDPTYVGASIGMCMPNYTTEKYEIIETKQF